MGDAITYSFWRGINYVRSRVVPNNPQSAAQTAVRDVLTDGVSKWRFGHVSQDDRNWWNTYAKGLGESGFNRYIREYIGDNYESGAQVDPQVDPDPK